MSNQEEHDRLCKELWAKKYFLLEKVFTWDGPVDWSKWEKQKPKIMFLLKEAYDDGHPTDWNPKFSPNVLRWKYALQELYKDRNADINFLSNEMPNNFEEQMKEVAFVEVKKLDERNKKSHDPTINHYAQEDRDFLRNQIELIDPHIIFCAKTIDACDIIFGGIEEDALISSKRIETCGCYKHGNRLIIDFYHPSRHHTFRLTNEEMFNLLCKIVQEGKNGSVFNEFDWDKI